MLERKVGLRIGKFDVSSHFFNQLRNAQTEEEYQKAKELLTILLRDMIVLEAEYNALENRFSYVAISDLFEPLEENKIIPTYQVIAEVKVDNKGNKEVSVEAQPYAVETYYFSDVRKLEE